jgi:predicted DNA-binding protein (MmcQ/YjbR family)
MKSAHMSKNKPMDYEAWRAFFLSMPAAVEDMPFGPEALVYKVAGKMFGLLAWMEEPLWMNLKCEPNLALSLRDQYSAVAAGYHMNKKHCNTVTLDGSVDDESVKEWVRASYDLIYLALPKKTQREMQNNRA